MTKGLPRSLSRATLPRSPISKQTVPIRAVTVSVVGASGVGFGNAVPFDFPEGNILILGAVANLAFTSDGVATIAAWLGDFSVGTTPVDDGTATGTDIDIVGLTGIGAASTQIITTTRGISVTATNAAVLDNTDGTLEGNLNMLIDDTSISGTSVITIEGEIYLSYVILGDDDL